MIKSKSNTEKSYKSEIQANKVAEDEVYQKIRAVVRQIRATKSEDEAVDLAHILAKYVKQYEEYKKGPYGSGQDIRFNLPEDKEVAKYRLYGNIKYVIMQLQGRITAKEQMDLTRKLAVLVWKYELYDNKGQRENEADNNKNPPEEKKEEPELAEILPLKNKPHEFRQSTKEIVNAIVSGSLIDDIDIAERVQDSKFRFSSMASSEISGAELSEAIAAVLAKSRSRAGIKGSAKTNQKRSKAADEYAKNMFGIVEDIKAANSKLTLREIAELLQNKGYTTPAKKTIWHPGTLLALEKRWEALGLKPDKSEAKTLQPK